MMSAPAARSDFEPFPIGTRFVIVPPQASAGLPGRIPLVAARGAFGSGEHETTASCLELLETLGPLDGLRVLDLGSGTGILAIAALLLGAAHAVLIDNDPRAMESSREHSRLNQITDRVELVEGELASSRHDSFDLVLANIHGDILIRVANDLVGVARPGARFVLSGIAWELNWSVRDTYHQLGCDVLRNRFLEEYSTVLLTKASSPV